MGFCRREKGKPASVCSFQLPLEFLLTSLVDTLCFSVAKLFYCHNLAGREVCRGLKVKKGLSGADGQERGWVLVELSSCTGPDLLPNRNGNCHRSWRTLVAD